jgi:hypothetical protein
MVLRLALPLVQQRVYVRRARRPALQLADHMANRDQEPDPR